MKEPHLREHVQRDFLKFTARQLKFDLEKNHPQVLEKFYVGARDRKYQIWERKSVVNLLLYSRRALAEAALYSPTGAGIRLCLYFFKRPTSPVPVDRTCIGQAAGKRTLVKRAAQADACAMGVRT